MNIEVVQGDLLNQPDLDIIVNAANTHMWHGGGIAGKIREAAGDTLVQESLSKRPCAVGGAIMTTAGDLPYKGVVHAVGPIWNGGDLQEMELLRKAHLNTLRLVNQKAFADADHGETIYEVPSYNVGFPAISCGIFRFPVHLAATVAITAVKSAPPTWAVNIVRFVCFDDGHYEAFNAALEASK